MALRDRIKRLQRAAEKDLETFRCAGCGETFKVPTEAWLNLLACDWVSGVRERGGDPGVEGERADALRTQDVEVLEEHLQHGELYEPGGRRAWPPGALT